MTAMLREPDDDALLIHLQQLAVAARRIDGRNRRMILGLESDLKSLLVRLQDRRDELARNLNAAGARSQAVNAYARTARSGA